MKTISIHRNTSYYSMVKVYVVSSVALFQEEDGEFGDDGYEVSNVTKVFNTRIKAEKFVTKYEDPEDENNWYRIQELKLE